MGKNGAKPAQEHKYSIFIELQNPRMVRIGRDLKDHLVII